MAGAPTEQTVEQIVKREEWDGNDDTRMLTYELLFAGDSRTYKWVKPAADDPGFQEGESVKGWKNPDGKFGVATGGGARKRSSNSSDGGKFDRRPEHPRNESRMIHTSALSAAPTYIEQMLTIGVAEQPKSDKEYWDLVSVVVSRLTRSYKRTMDDQQSLPVPGKSEAPAGTEGQESQVDDEIPF